MSGQFVYASEPRLDPAEFREVLIASGLAAIRPVDDASRLAAMLANASLIVTARRDTTGGALVGLARGISDGVWCCYLSEVAVNRDVQGLGVGRGLLEEARRQVGSSVALFLASVPEAAGFYERAGMARLPDAFWYRRER